MPAEDHPDASPHPLDALIFGGGVAGLWILDTLTRRGYTAALSESHALGGAQTGWSQGILHSGLKYALAGAPSAAAGALAELPARWHDALEALAAPDLSKVHVRSRHCWLWRTEALRSRLGMLGARLALRTKPEIVPPDQRPPALRAAPGEVAHLGEWVIDPRSLARTFAQAHHERLIHARPDIEARPPGTDGRWRITLTAHDAQTITLAPRIVVLAAGAGNAALRARFGLSSDAQQIRPLRMITLKGPLPELHGHCVDGNATRVTITTIRARMDDGAAPEHEPHPETVWQIGGQIAERGPSLPADEHLRLAIRELRQTIPGLRLAGCAIGAYEAPRAEGRSPGGRRPDDIVLHRDGSVLTVWPTKLVLAPRAGDEVARAVESIAPPGGALGAGAERVAAMAAPPVGDYAWELPTHRWTSVAELLRGTPTLDC
ncbi:MAG: FAD-dependent oxidoreductase [Phycisphaerales bacterium]